MGFSDGVGFEVPKSAACEKTMLGGWMDRWILLFYYSFTLPATECQLSC